MYKRDPYGTDRFSHGLAGQQRNRDHRDRSKVRSIPFLPRVVRPGRRQALSAPGEGSDTDWYKNLLKTPTIRLEAHGKTYTTSATPITDEAQVGEVVKKFRDKYGAGTVNTLYSRLDVAVEVPLT